MVDAASPDGGKDFYVLKEKLADQQRQLDGLNSARQPVLAAVQQQATMAGAGWSAFANAIDYEVKVPRGYSQAAVHLGGSCSHRVDSNATLSLIQARAQLQYVDGGGTQAFTGPTRRGNGLQNAYIIVPIGLALFVQNLAVGSSLRLRAQVDNSGAQIVAGSADAHLTGMVQFLP